MEMPKGWELEVFKFLLNFLLLIITWTIGKKLLEFWENRRRLREISLEIRGKFHKAYGDFKSLVKMWKILGKPSQPDKDSELVKAAVDAEGRVEDLLISVTAVKCLKPEDITTLGLLRQGYQTVREAIEKGESEKVPYNYKSYEYRLFNILMTQVSRLMTTAKEDPNSDKSRNNLAQIVDVRSKEWEKAIELIGKGMPFEDLLKEVTNLRTKRLTNQTKS